MRTQQKFYRHSWGDMKSHGSFEDGTYQTCARCGAVRFQGDRYAYMRVKCLPRTGGKRK